MKKTAKTKPVKGSKPAPVADVAEQDEDFVDLASPKIIRTLLEEAFASYVPPSVLDHIPEHPTKKHPRDKRKRDGSKKLTPLEAFGKFNVATCMRVVNMLSVGAFFRDSCKCAGVTYKTGREWIKKGFGKDEPIGSPYWIFARAVENVSASVKGRGLASINNTLQWHKHSLESAKVWISFLKMRFPKDFAEHSTVDTTSNGYTIGGARAMRGINIVYVDAATASPDGHSFIEETQDDSEGDKVDDLLDLLN